VTNSAKNSADKRDEIGVKGYNGLGILISLYLWRNYQGINAQQRSQVNAAYCHLRQTVPGTGQMGRI
jgi:hypothetical protein